MGHTCTTSRGRGVPPTSTLRPSDAGGGGCTWQGEPAPRYRLRIGPSGGERLLRPERRGRDGTHLRACGPRRELLTQSEAGQRGTAGSPGATSAQRRLRTPAAPPRTRRTAPPRPSPPRSGDTRYLSLRPPCRDPGPRDPARPAHARAVSGSSPARFRSLAERRARRWAVRLCTTPSFKGGPSGLRGRSPSPGPPGRGAGQSPEVLRGERSVPFSPDQ